MCWRPPSSPTIVGNAVATIVWSSAASSRTSISPEKMTPTRALSELAGASAVVAAADIGAAETTPARRDGGPRRGRASLVAAREVLERAGAVQRTLQAGGHHGHRRPELGAAVGEVLAQPARDAAGLGEDDDLVEAALGHRAPHGLERVAAA